MPVRTTLPYNDGLYFITLTCHQWLPLIELTKSYDLVYKWFDYLKSKGHYISGYIIMPNHIHVLIGFRNCGKSINTIIGNGKRFIAYEIIKRLQQQGQDDLLQQLRNAVERKDRERNKLHEVWEDSFDWKECRGDNFINQKLNYMHNNCCNGKWSLSEGPADYEYSSARYYICGEHAAYVVTNYMELADVDLTSSSIAPSPGSAQG
ncbi:MAG: transposase [Chitinophagaceae bacterium]